MSGAAANPRRLRDSARAKYELVHSVRTHLGCEDDAFGCMGNGEDSEGTRGVFLRRNVIAVAGRALKANLTRLGPLVLPISELVRACLPPQPCNLAGFVFCASRFVRSLTGCACRWCCCMELEPVPQLPIYAAGTKFLYLE